MPLWGDKEDVLLAGTGSLDANTGVLTGVGTSFNVDVAVGDVIRINKQKVLTKLVANATSLEVMPVVGNKDLESETTGQRLSISGQPKFTRSQSLMNANNIAFISYEESKVAGNKAKGLDSPGWYHYNTYVDAKGDTRWKVEKLVAFNKTQAYAGDRPNDIFPNGTSSSANVADQSLREGAMIFDVPMANYVSITPTSYTDNGTLPAGLSIDSSTGVITGNPTESGLFNVAIEASDGSSSETKNFTITVGNWYANSSVAYDFSGANSYLLDANNDVKAIYDVFGNITLTYREGASDANVFPVIASNTHVGALSIGNQSDASYTGSWTGSLGPNTSWGLAYSIEFEGMPGGAFPNPATISKAAAVYNQSTIRFDIDREDSVKTLRMFNDSGTQVNFATTWANNAPNSEHVSAMIFFDGDNLYQAWNGWLELYSSNASIDAHFNGAFADNVITLFGAYHTSGGTRTHFEGQHWGASFFNDSDNPTLEKASQVAGGLMSRVSSTYKKRPTFINHTIGNSLMLGSSPSSPNTNVAADYSRARALLPISGAGTYREQQIYSPINAADNGGANVTTLLGDNYNGGHSGRSSDMLWGSKYIIENTSALALHMEAGRTSSTLTRETAVQVGSIDYWNSAADAATLGHQAGRTSLYDLAKPEWDAIYNNIIKGSPAIDQDHKFISFIIDGIIAQEANQFGLGAANTSISQVQDAMRLFLDRLISDYAPDLIVWHPVSSHPDRPDDFTAHRAAEAIVLAEYSNSNVVVGCTGTADPSDPLIIDADRGWVSGSSYIANNIHYESEMHEARGIWTMKSLIIPQAVTKWYG